jgi:hypothetical protein
MALHLPKIIVECIPHKKQRYDTTGDWRKWKKHLHVSISQMDFDKEMETLLHELFEWGECLKAGITTKMVDDWDFSHPDAADPGSLKGCPYGKQHMNAMKISRLAVTLMGHNWNDYLDDYDLLADKLSRRRTI